MGFAGSVLLALLGACGGGNSTPPPLYSVGGTITGVSASGLVLANGIDTLNVNSGATSFAFGTTAVFGTAYDVQVQTAPEGYLCTVANGSGYIGDANVTLVQVVCTNAGTNTVWVPLGAGGSFGLGAPGSLLLASVVAPTPTAISVSNDPAVLVFGVSQKWQSASGALTGSYWPVELLFLATGPDGKRHFYGVDLTDPHSTAPLPVQVGSYSLNEAAAICSFSPTMQRTLTDPTTAFIALQVDTSGACNNAAPSPTDSWILLHFNDSPSTPPVRLPVPSDYMLPVYGANGALSYVVVADINGAHQLSEYSDPSFSTPKVLLSNITGFSPIIDVYLGKGGYVGDTWYASVHTTNSGGDLSLWRFPASGTASQAYTSGAATQYMDYSGAASDASNIYFEDSAGAIIELPIASATPTSTQLITQQQLPQNWGMLSSVGSDGTHLVVTYKTAEGGGVLQLATVAVAGPANQMPIPIGGDGTAGPGQYTTNGAAPDFDLFFASGQVFVSSQMYDQTSGRFIWTSQQVSPTGTIAMSAVNTLFLNETCGPTGSLAEMHAPPSTTRFASGPISCLTLSNPGVQPQLQGFEPPSNNASNIAPIGGLGPGRAYAQPGSAYSVLFTGPPYTYPAMGSAYIVNWATDTATLVQVSGALAGVQLSSELPDYFYNPYGGY
jgi:hypothetical protein